MDEALAMIVGTAKYYYHANHLYSVAALTNQAGGVVERYRYDTYGQRIVLAADGVTTRAASSYNQQVGFTGRYLDKETGLYYFRARHYSGTLGRFIGRDNGSVKTNSNIFVPEQGMGYYNGFNLYNGYYVPNLLDPAGYACVNTGASRVLESKEKPSPFISWLAGVKPPLSDIFECQCEQNCSEYFFTCAQYGWGVQQSNWTQWTTVDKHNSLPYDGYLKARGQISDVFGKLGKSGDGSTKGLPGSKDFPPLGSPPIIDKMISGVGDLLDPGPIGESEYNANREQKINEFKNSCKEKCKK